MLRTLCLVLALLAGLAVPGAPWSVAPAAAQQTVGEIDYAAWEKIAERAEDAIEAGRASTPALEALREELTTWRQRFLDAQDINQNAIETVQNQLDALGPAPETGESPEIARQREQLNARLADLRAPVKRAEAAHSRADGLIKGIDRIIRDRQTQELLELGPSPLNPVHWGAGLAALYDTAAQIRQEVLAAWDNPVQRSESQEDLPAIIVLLLGGILLLARGRRWSRRLMARVLQGPPGPGRWLLAFLVSLGELVLPLAGALLVIQSLFATELLGVRGEQLLTTLRPAIFIFLLARWLALRIFPQHELRTAPLRLEPADRAAGRIYGGALGLVIAAFYLLDRVGAFAGWSAAASNVVVFPVMVVAGLLLWRLSRLLIIHSHAADAPDHDDTYRDRGARLLARALTVLAVVAPLLAAAGYFSAAERLLLPSLLSLELLAALLVLQRVVTELYVLLTGNREGAAESLVPVLIGAILVILSGPIFALIWGARVADLTELWTTFTEGVQLGETRISPAVFLTFALVFAMGFVITRMVQGALRNTVLPKTKIDPGGRTAIVSGTGYVGVFLAAIIAITSAGIDLSSLAIVAGALSVGIGFGLQNIVSNFVSGIILLIERPISEGDWIEVGGKHGYVKDISVRSTRIETFDRTDVIVPNADFVSGTVTNYTRGNTVGRVIVGVGVAYGTDTRKVEKILQEVAEDHPLVLANPAPYVVFMAFGPDSLQFEIRAILRDVNWVLNVHSDMNHEIARRFAEAGIEIPFVQRDIWLRNPEALSGLRGAAAGAGTDSEPAASMIAKEDLPGEAPDSDGGDQ